jgi:hypothetical protein
MIGGMTKMPDATESPDSAVRLEAGRVAAVFSWQDDRWRHAVLIDGVPRYESLEGPEPPAADPRWPAAPVLTEVSRIDVAGSPAIGGVGRAGRSHYSLSMARHPERPDTLVVEVACRIHESPGWLGSTYRAIGADAAVRIAADAGPAPAGEPPPSLPRTVVWSYLLSPGGIGPPEIVSLEAADWRGEGSGRGATPGER